MSKQRQKNENNSKKVSAESHEHIAISTLNGRNLYFVSVNILVPKTKTIFFVQGFRSHTLRVYVHVF